MAAAAAEDNGSGGDPAEAGQHAERHAVQSDLMGWKNPADRREYQNATRALLRSLRLCTECKTGDSRTKSGLRLCARCAAKKAVYQRTYKQKRKKERKSRAQLQNAGR